MAVRGEVIPLGYEFADLMLFLREISKRPGVISVWVDPNCRPAEIIVGVDKGLSEEGYDLRQSLYEEFEAQFRDYRVREFFNVDYRIVPIGDDLSAPQLPDDLVQISGQVVAVG